MRSQSVAIERELVSSYLSYSLSVIIGRAIPDIRDGFKPVQRRIIWTMWEEGITSKAQYRKSAKIVGSCIGKYHPHGDKPVYDALVRLAQDFVMRYPLIDGQGNFGSMDGDEPAAMRYTEARLTSLAEEILKDIHEGTVDFIPNYDESLTEPKYLPARFPNILVNGTSGIAVGMSTSIPPHNISEVADALIFLLDNQKASQDSIIEIIKGPDFPTGGLVVGDMRSLYKEGKGQVTIYARYNVEKRGSLRTIVFYEVPYQQNKSKIVEKIAELARNKIIDGIVRVADESDRRGVRIVIDVKEGFDIDSIVSQIYESTPLKSTFPVNMLVIDGIQPVSVDLITILKRFLDFRKEVVIKRTKFRLERAEKHLHILEGYMKALDIIDEVIKVIRASESQPSAEAALVRNFGFSELQAQAICNMRLGRLSRLEVNQLRKEYEETQAEVKRLKLILKSPEELRRVVKEEILEIKQKFGDARRSEISDKPPVKVSAQVQEYKVVLTHDFYVSIFAKTERVRKLSVRSSFFASGDLAVVSNLGKVYRLRLDKIKGWTEKGMPVSSLVRLSKDERVIYVGPADEDKKLVFLTKNGFTKKFRLSEVYDMTARGEVVFELEGGDEICDAVECSEGDLIFFITRGGMILGVKEEDITARVSRAIELGQKRTGGSDSSLCVLSKGKDDNILVVATLRFIKGVRADELKIQSKGGMGIILVPDKAGDVVDAVFVSENDELCITYKRSDGREASKYINVRRVPILSRQAIGRGLVEGEIIGLGKVI